MPKKREWAMIEWNLSRWLKARDITQRAFADVLGVHFTTVNRWVVSGEIPKWVPLTLKEVEQKAKKGGVP